MGKCSWERFSRGKSMVSRCSWEDVHGKGFQGGSQWFLDVHGNMFMGRVFKGNSMEVQQYND